MHALTFLTALASILQFEGGRRVFASPRSRAAWLIVLSGVASVAAAAYLHVAEQTVYRTLALDEGERFKAGPPWTHPKEALPNLPITEQAEKTRILAVGYYTSTGKLVDHLSPDGSVVRLAPTQEEIDFREHWLSWKVSIEAHLTHTTDRPFHLLLIALAAGAALLVFRPRHAKSAT